jgi:hypothetical protein
MRECVHGRWLIGIGGALQVIGVVTAGVGVRRTWREFSTEPFWDFIVIPAGNLGPQIAARLWGLFRRSHPVTIRGGAVSGIRLDAIGLFLIASGVVFQGVGSLLA